VAIYLGIDGGATKTTCAVSDGTSVIGLATAGGCNVIRLGEARAKEALQTALRQACAAGGVSTAQIEGACVGASGAGRAEVSDVIARMMAELMPCRVHVVGDIVIALQAAFGNGPGIVVNAGTGSFAYGRDANGKISRAGGWGFAVSDEGSGQWIGRTAVGAVLRAQENGDKPGLLASIEKEWKTTSLNDLVQKANASPPPDFSALFPVVLLAANSGDPVARGVLARAGNELAELTKSVVRRLFGGPGNVPVAMVGGVFRQSALVRQVFYNQLAGEFANVAVNPTVVEPVLGALELARIGAGGK
jgi:N-acetylglucosamine kinase-like BadF-type ATPase